MNKRGQLSIINLIYFMILIVVSIVISPIIRGFIDVAITRTNNSMEILMLNAILPVYWILLIGVLVFYAIPRGQGVQY